VKSNHIAHHAQPLSIGSLTSRTFPSDQALICLISTEQSGSCGEDGGSYPRCGVQFVKDVADIDAG
jgi:hypothetical protein